MRKQRNIAVAKLRTRGGAGPHGGSTHAQRKRDRSAERRRLAIERLAGQAD